MPGSCQRDTSSASWGRLLRNQSSRRSKSGSFSSSSGSMVVTAKRGIRPTIERTLSGKCAYSVLSVQHIVEELVLLVPERDAVAADVVHRAGDVQEVLEELGGDVFVDRVLPGQFQRDGQHIEAEHAHPACAVALLDVAAGGEGRAAVEHADVVQAQEAALEDVHALGVLAVDPPGEVEQQLVEDALQEGAVAFAHACFCSIL